MCYVYWLGKRGVNVRGWGGGGGSMQKRLLRASRCPWTP